MEINLDGHPDAALAIARAMCVAARTAPKARGVDNLVTGIVVPGADVEALAALMRSYTSVSEASFYARDAGCLEASAACVLLGTRLSRLGIPGCDLCGFAGCAASARAGARCAYNVGDLGVAVGSAVSIAADHRVDCRVMFSVGRAAVELGLLGREVGIAFGIPLSVTGKSIFFDRH